MLFMHVYFFVSTPSNMSRSEPNVTLDSDDDHTPTKVGKDGKLHKIKEKFNEHKKAAIVAIIAIIVLAVALYFFFKQVPNYWVGGGLVVGALALGGLSYYLYKKDSEVIVAGGAKAVAKKTAKKVVKKEAAKKAAKKATKK
jgi:hypothetical protein